MKQSIFRTESHNSATNMPISTKLHAGNVTSVYGCMLINIATYQSIEMAKVSLVIFKGSIFGGTCHFDRILKALRKTKLAHSVLCTKHTSFLEYIALLCSFFKGHPKDQLLLINLFTDALKLTIVLHQVK